MDRRDFLKAAILAAVAPSLFLPRVSAPLKWKRSPNMQVWVPNPEYVDAPYEIAFFVADKMQSLKFVTDDIKKMMSDDKTAPLVFRRGMSYRPEGLNYQNHYPVRLNEKGEVVPIMVKQT